MGHVIVLSNEENILCTQNHCPQWHHNTVPCIEGVAVGYIFITCLPNVNRWKSSFSWIVDILCTLITESDGPCDCLFNEINIHNAIVRSRTTYSTLRRKFNSSYVGTGQLELIQSIIQLLGININCKELHSMNYVKHYLCNVPATSLSQKAKVTRRLIY